MQGCDILILGGGIASAGLAFNLKRLGYQGTVAVLERDRPGGAKAYGYRNTFKEVIDDYGLPYRKIFAGLRDAVTTGGPDILWKDIDIPCYFFEYGEACESLFHRSSAAMLRGEALRLDLGRRRLAYSGGEIEFGILVDCSGPKAWTRAILGLPRVQRFYIGKTFSMPFPRGERLPDFFDGDRFIYYTEANGYMEDVYALGEELLYGVWNYSPTPDPDIEIRDGGLLSRFGRFAEMRTRPPYTAAISAEAVYPIAYGPIAYLGDSCGQATPASSEGTRPILGAARLLAETIAGGHALEAYQKEWLRRTGFEYSLHRALKQDMRSYNHFFTKLREYPDVYRDLALNLSPMIPLKVLFTSIPYLAQAYLAGRRQLSIHKKHARARILTTD